MSKQHAPSGCGHGFGLQLVPGPWYVPPNAAHWNPKFWRHVPSALQHAPATQTLSAQFVLLPAYTPPIAWQLAGVTSVRQAPARQQAPRAVQETCAHVSPLDQTLPYWAVQAACVTPLTHVPSAWQQAPVGCGQGFGVQVVPPPCHMPVQFACVTSVHEPFEKQQAPVGCGQGFGVQVVPPPW